MTAGAPAPPADLLTSREFLAPAVREAVASLRLPAGAWVLDAGTGGGGALPPLARAVGAAGRVRAVDTDPVAVELAAGYVARHRLPARVSVELADLVDVVDRAATEPDQGFDVIWAGDVVCPQDFADPAAAVAAMARALRPNGVLALFYANPHQAVFLPGHARLERLVRAASERHRGLPPDGYRHHDRHLSWLAAAGLERLSLGAFPRVGLRVDTDRTVRTYLESTVWPELQVAALTGGQQTGMTDDDVADLHALTTPGGPRYLPDDPGYHVVLPTVLAAGRRAHGGRR